MEQNYKITCGLLASFYRELYCYGIPNPSIKDKKNKSASEGSKVLWEGLKNVFTEENLFIIVRLFHINSMCGVWQSM